MPAAQCWSFSNSEVLNYKHIHILQAGLIWFHYVPDLIKSHPVIDLPQAGHVGNQARWHIVLLKFLCQPLLVREQVWWQIPIPFLHILLDLEMKR